MTDEIVYVLVSQTFGVGFDEKVDNYVLKRATAATFIHDGTVKSSAFAYAVGFRYPSRVWLEDPCVPFVHPVDACDSVLIFATKKDFEPGRVAMRVVLDKALRAGKNVEIVFGDTNG